MRALWALQQVLAGLRVGGQLLGRVGAVESHFIHLASTGHVQPCSSCWQKRRTRLAAPVARSLQISVCICAGTSCRFVSLPAGPGKEGTGGTARRELCCAIAVRLRCAAVIKAVMDCIALLQAQEEKELAALRAAKQRALAQRDVQLQQLEALKQRILAEQAADRAEGALIRQRALEEAEQLKQKVRLAAGCLRPCPRWHLSRCCAVASWVCFDLYAAMWNPLSVKPA